jgi:hypothetical protein
VEKRGGQRGERGCVWGRGGEGGAGGVHGNNPSLLSAASRQATCESSLPASGSYWDHLQDEVFTVYSPDDWVGIVLAEPRHIVQAQRVLLMVSHTLHTSLDSVP